MARIRTTKPEFYSDEKVMAVCPLARYLFKATWHWVDDMGRMQYSMRQLKALIFPGDDDISAKQVDKWMQELASVDLLRFYTDPEGKQKLFWIPSFTRHQKIDRPSHSILPAHPSDRRPDCLCWACKSERNERNGRRNVPVGTHRAFSEDSMNRRGLDDDSTRREVGREVGNVGSKNNTNTNTNTSAHIDENASAEQEQAREKEGLTDRRALEEFSVGVLNLLQLTDQTLKDTIIKSIKVKARSEGLSLEAAGQRIASRAAYIAGKAPPENWAEWFADARYQYVPEGDPRLQDKQIEARPTCGSNLCDNGWETVKVNGHALSRRCPDCLQLWQDANLD